MSLDEFFFFLFLLITCNGISSSSTSGIWKRTSDVNDSS